MAEHDLCWGFFAECGQLCILDRLTGKVYTDGRYVTYTCNTEEELAESKGVETKFSQDSNTGSRCSKRGDCIMKNSAFPPELLQKSYQTVSGELAWRVSDVPCLLEHAARENLVILGGDVVTLQGVYAYDNWYYEVSNLQSVKTAVHGSIATARKYVHDYVQKNGNEFLFVLVMQKLLGVVDGNIYWDHD